MSDYRQTGNSYSLTSKEEPNLDDVLFKPMLWIPMYGVQLKYCLQYLINSLQLCCHDTATFC